MTDPARITRDLFYKNADPAKVQRIVDRELAGCDEGELYLESRVAESLSLFDRKISTSFSIKSGFGVRYTMGESVAFRPSTDISEAGILKEAQTVRKIRNHPAGSIVVSELDITAPSLRETLLYTANDPFLGYDKKDKIELLRKINQYLRDQDSRVKNAAVSLVAEYACVEIVRPGMAPVHDIRPLVRMNIAAYMKGPNGLENSGTGMGGRYDFTKLFDESSWKSLADEVLEEGRLLVAAKDAPSGQMPVVLGSGWPGIMLHEAVGHGLEGDFNRKGESAFSGRLGELVTSRNVTVIDQGDIPNRRGSLNVDDEGNPTRKNVLIEDGILKGYMQDAMNARLMGVAPTGNGRRESFAHPPQPRMTNTYMEPTRAEEARDPEEIVASMKKGLYAPGFSKGSVDITSGDFNFNATAAWVVIDGKKAYPVRGATIVGNGPEAMKQIAMLGNDVALDRGIGICGKNGQGVPVGVGQPTTLINGLTVGGRGGPL